MKTIKILFVTLFLSTFFIACETDSVNDEVGIEDNLEVVGEDEADEVQPQK